MLPGRVERPKDKPSGENLVLHVERAAVHRLFDPGQTNRVSTRDADLPEKTKWREWDERRVRSWAAQVGPDAVIVIARIFQSAGTPDQAIDPALAVPGLSRRYGRQRLERACDVARRVVNTPRHRRLKTILDTGQDHEVMEDETLKVKGLDAEPPAGYVRGADCYARGGEAMRLDERTRLQLRDMGCMELLDAFVNQDDDACAAPDTQQRIRLAVDEAHAAFTDKRVGGLARRARLRYPQADLRTLDLLDERGISREMVASLADCSWVERHRNIVAQGYCGSGKS